MAVSGCFYGAPGEIRTPDLVVRSHALFFAFAPVNIALFYIGYPTVSGDRASYGPLNIVTIGYCGTTVGQQLGCSDRIVA